CPRPRPRAPSPLTPSPTFSFVLPPSSERCPTAEPARGILPPSPLTVFPPTLLGTLFLCMASSLCALLNPRQRGHRERDERPEPTFFISSRDSIRPPHRKLISLERDQDCMECSVAEIDTKLPRSPRKTLCAPVEDILVRTAIVTEGIARVG